MKKVSVGPIRNRKPINLVLFLFAILIIANFNESKSDWLINNGTTTEYTIEEAEWTVEFGELSESGEGGQFESVKIEPSDTFDVIALDVDDIWGVEFKLDNSTATAIGIISSDAFYYEFVNFIYYPAVECARLAYEGFNEQRIMHGPEIPKWFFIEPSVELWNFFDEITDINYHKTRENNYDYEAYFEAYFERRDDQAIFDLHMYGDFLNDTLEIAMQFDHNIKFVWQESTGILNGLRMNTVLSGDYGNQTIGEDVSLVLMKSSYTLPDFKFFAYTGFIPGFNFGIAVISIFSIIVVSIIFTKVKRRKS